MTKKWHCHVISNTHWDREWRYPFQAYRMDLVDMMDRLLDLLERRAEYRAFYLDSQTVILEDYLEIRPENAERVRRLVEKDRLQIGPWYTLPDMWACPGEALVRNLLRGHRVAKQFGRVQKIGYTPFSNGQISQLPQLYTGFGIDHCLFYRGVGKHVAKSEFVWRGADGTEILGFRFGDYARYNYYYLLYRPGLLGRTVRDREYHWNPEEIPFHVAVDQSQDRQYGYGNMKLSVRNEMLDQALDDALRYTAADATTSQLLYMMGHDHSFAAEEELNLLDALAKRCEEREEEVFHSTFGQYLDAFRKEARDLQVLEGEMRHTLKEGLWTNLMALILSCRTYLKQQNARTCAQVLYGSEPLAAMASITGSPYPAAFFDEIWKRLLVNQAHDAVGGCSVDRVHVEMQARWGEVETISDEICRRAMRDVALRIDGSSIPPSDLQLTVFNPLPYQRDIMSEFIIDLPTDDPHALFCVDRADGKPVPLQIVSHESYTATIESGYELTMTFPVQRFRTRLALDAIPAYGYEALRIRPSSKPCGCDAPDIVRNETTLENELLRIELQSDGTFTLIDKRSDRRYEKLGVLEDTAEFGDPWNRVVPDDDKPLYSTTKCSATPRIVERGPLYGAIELRYDFSVPKGEDPRGRRTREKVKLPVAVRVGLERGSACARVELRLTNTAENHRLRILFPSGIREAQFSTADGQFDVLQRPITLPDSTGWKEPPYPTHPMWNWVEVNNGTRGFAVINDGLIEYEVMDDAERTIAVTLLRAFGTFVFGRPTPGSQCLGDHLYRFIIYPHDGTWESAKVFEHVRALVAPVQAILSAPTRGQLPRQASFISLEGDQLIFSALKQAEDGRGFVVRFWNPTSEPQKATLRFGVPIARAERLTLEELTEEPISVEEGGRRIELEVATKKIVTLRLEWPQPQ